VNENSAIAFNCEATLARKWKAAATRCRTPRRFARIFDVDWPLVAPWTAACQRRFHFGYPKSLNKFVGLQAQVNRNQDNHAELRSAFAQEMESGSYPAAALQGAPREFSTSIGRAQCLGLRRVSAAFTSGYSKSLNKFAGLLAHVNRSQGNRAE